MSLIDEVLSEIDKNHSKDFNCISFSEIFPRFSNYIPGVINGTYYAITGGPSAGKTQFTDYTFLYKTLDFAETHGIELEIDYFSFELSAKAKTREGVSRKLFIDEGLRFSPNHLRAVGERLNEDQRHKVKQVRSYFKQLESKVTFHDDPMTASQIFKIQMEKMRANGVYDPIKGTYIPNNPDKYILFITDHVGLIQPEPGQSLHQALGVFSANNIFLRNRFGATIVNIHQQGIDGQVEQFTNKGDNIASKIEPKLSGLGDNRTLGRDYDIVLGLFSPYKHEIDFYRGYKTKRFGDKCRFVSVVKNRQGPQDISVGLYFDGAVGYFEELPKAEEFSIIKAGQKIDNEDLYNKYSKGLVGVLSKDKQKTFNF